MIHERHANLYCKDEVSKIENYDKAIADTAHTWDLHHRLELTLDGELAHSRDELKRLGMYYNRPYFELIFLTKDEHMRLHKKGKNNHFYGKKEENTSMYGKHHSEESRKKMAESHKGKPLSSEHRQKIAESLKGKSFTDEHRRRLSESLKGENNYIYGKHHSDEAKRKMSEAHKGKTLSFEHRQKIAEAAKRRHSKHNSDDYSYNCQSYDEALHKNS